MHANSYPQLQRLHDAKAAATDATAGPATYLRTDLRASLPGHTKGGNVTINDLLPVKYDVIIIDPPLQTYAWDSATGSHCWSWDEVATLPVPRLAAKESFVFLWVGSGAGGGLERGRQILASWGYRRCEDIVWVRTGESTLRTGDAAPLTPTVQHCLMGIRGTVVRSTDSFFVHCNVDVDVILWEGEKEPGSGLISLARKPHQLYRIAENFCLGTRRIELFGTNRNLRPGWLTVGCDVGPDKPEWRDAVAYAPDEYNARFGVDPPACPLQLRSNLMPFSTEIEFLRPKTPPTERRAKHEKYAALNTLGDAAGCAMAPVPVPAAMPVPVFSMPAPPYPAAPVPALAQYPPVAPECYTPFAPYAPAMVPWDPYAHAVPYMPLAPAPVPYGIHRPPRDALLGQGAGGPTTVSVHSCNDKFSGAQAEVIERWQRQRM